jgi:putative membrane protein
MSEERKHVMCTRRFIAAAGGLALAFAAAPLSALHSQVTQPQDSTARPPAGTNAGPIIRKPQARPDVAADSAFIREALVGNQQEIRLGTLAEQKATNPAVKQFAQRMVTDHTTMGNQWIGLAASNGLPLKPSADSAQEQEAGRLEQLSGAEFDRAYMTSMIQDHQQDVETFQSRGPSANSAEARQLAASGLVTIRQHLSMAMQVGREVGATNVAAAPPAPQATPESAKQNGQAAPQPVAGARNTLEADQAYIRNVAAGNLMEIRMGEMAQRKAADPDVKRFAERMVTDFTQWQNRWTGMASRNGMPFEPGMGRLHRQKVDRLQNVSGARFDRAYMTTVIQHFQALLPYFQKEGRSARSPQVRNLVENELPALRQYLALARRTGRQVNADLTGSGRDRNVSVTK